MKPKRTKKRKKPFRSSKRNCHHERADRLLAGGAGMAADSDTNPIIEKALEHFVTSEEATCSNADDGRLSISGRTSGIVLCDVSGQEAKQ